jgi:hypothetical protein
LVLAKIVDHFSLDMALIVQGLRSFLSQDMANGLDLD